MIQRIITAAVLVREKSRVSLTTRRCAPDLRGVFLPSAHAMHILLRWWVPVVTTETAEKDLRTAL